MGSNTYWWIVCGVLVALIIFFGRDMVEGDDRGRFLSNCEAAVERQLKTPSTASFVNPTTSDVTGGPESFRWEGAVDAENSFGARIRTTFYCQGSADAPLAVLQ